MPAPARILVVGVGAIGGTVAAGLLRQDPALVAQVVPLSRNPEVVAALGARGFVLRGPAGEEAVPGAAVAGLSEGTEPFDFVLLATQPPQVEAAARAALPWLAPGGALVTLQNGLCEDRVAAVAGPDRVLGAIVSWGASSPEPGVFERTSAGGFTLGRMDGAQDPRLDQLAINCAISSLGTLGGDRLGALMRHRIVRRLALEIMTEVVAVARAEGIALERVSGTFELPWLALDEARRGSAPALVARHSLLLLVGAKYRRLRSSMLAAIERGRPPAVDFLNGEVVDRAAAHGIEVPANAACRRRVHALAAGEFAPGLPAIHALAEELGLRP